MNILYLSTKKSWRGVVDWMHKTALALQKRNHNVWILTHKKSDLGHNADKKLNIIKRNLGPEYNFVMIIWLVYYIRKHKIDLLLTNIEKEIEIGGIAAKICKIPNIRRVGREDDFFKRFKTKINHKYLVSHSIVPCNYVSEKINQNNNWIDKSNFTTIYNGRNIFTASIKQIEAEKKRLKIPNQKKLLGLLVIYTK